MPAYFALALIATALALASRAAGHPLSLHPAGEVRAPVAHLIAHTRQLTERALTRRCRPQRAYRWARAYRIPVELRPGVLSFQRGELRRARGLSSVCRNVPAVIRMVFAGYGEQAVRVAWCESRHSVNAVNGQYLGLFQMGSWERSTYGHGPDALSQSRAAWRYFRASGSDWSPWACKP